MLKIVVILAHAPNVSGLVQCTVNCSAITLSSDVIETLTVQVTIVIYPLSKVTAVQSLVYIYMQQYAYV